MNTVLAINVAEINQSSVVRTTGSAAVHRSSAKETFARLAFEDKSIQKSIVGNLLFDVRKILSGLILRKSFDKLGQTFDQVVKP